MQLAEWKISLSVATPVPVDGDRFLAEAGAVELSMSCPLGEAAAGADGFPSDCAPTPLPGGEFPMSLLD